MAAMIYVQNSRSRCKYCVLL